MDLESVKKYLEKGGDQEENHAFVASLRSRFFESFIHKGIHVDLLEYGRLVCSMKVPPHMLNSGNFMHGGAIATMVDIIGSAVFLTIGMKTSGVSVDINVSYVDAAYADEEIEIESKALKVGKFVNVASVEFRKKETGKIIAQGVTPSIYPTQANFEQFGSIFTHF